MGVVMETGKKIGYRKKISTILEAPVESSRRTIGS
jgi:hypothetical protein